MDEQFLSSEELRELTKDFSDPEKSQISSEEIDTLGEIGNISIGTSATTLYSLLRKIELPSQHLEYLLQIFKN